MSKTQEICLGILGVVFLCLWIVSIVMWLSNFEVGDETHWVFKIGTFIPLLPLILGALGVVG